MSVINVKVKYIRPCGYNNLCEWCSDTNNIYIGRKGVVFINNVRYPPDNSIFHNPFKIGRDGDRNEVLKKYKEYILKKIEKESGFKDSIKSLKGKNLGCWCHPLPCHGDILLEVLNTLKIEDDYS
jgi:hypothetical protein